jgi:hypothetical protein
MTGTTTMTMTWRADDGHIFMTEAVEAAPLNDVLERIAGDDGETLEATTRVLRDLHDTILRDLRALRALRLNAREAVALYGIVARTHDGDDLTRARMARRWRMLSPMRRLAVREAVHRANVLIAGAGTPPDLVDVLQRAGLASA